MSLSYSFCARLIPLLPVTYVSATNGSSRRFLSLRSTRVHSTSIATIAGSLVVVVALAPGVLAGTVRVLLPDPATAAISSAVKLPTFPVRCATSITSNIGRKFGLATAKRLATNSLEWTMPWGWSQSPEPDGSFDCGE